MSTIIEDPLSGRRFLGLALISIALILSISNLTDKRVEVKTPQVGVQLARIEPQVDASSLQDYIKEVEPEKPPEPTEAPEPVAVVETPPPVVEEPVKPAVKPKPIQPAPQISGSKYDWLAASGIPEDQWPVVDWLVQKESGWNPNAINRSSGACGLAQALPCAKIANSGLTWNDPVDSLKWQYRYVQARYGSYHNAKEFWACKGSCRSLQGTVNKESTWY